MPQPGMGIAAPVAHGADGHEGRYAEVQRARRATYRSQVCHMLTHTHKTGQTPPHISVWGLAVTWRRVQ